ncbi:lipid transfer protein EARLI 1-like [Mercurialis annua]|uniref:lipid transfer protein EARLI 1-like n=1 Tax=Mercurialis annua TaxID=3986 RepID=UPI00215DEEC9|nr:lipid transfer protein EARLI 1-like [Mercurialis annua]
MASKIVASTSLLLSLSLLFLTLVSSTYYTSEPMNYAPDYSSHPSSTTPKAIDHAPGYSSHPTITEPMKYAPDYSTHPSSTSPKAIDYAPDYSSHPTTAEPINYAPDYTSSPYSEPAKCPRDTLKLGVCVGLLKDLLSVTVGTPPHSPCCSLIGDLVDLEAAVCVCTTIKASLLGVNLNLPINLSLLLNYCGKQVPEGFYCA